MGVWAERVVPRLTDVALGNDDIGEMRAVAEAPAPRRPRWDFEEESPLRDARGFDMARQIADPTQLTDLPVAQRPVGQPGHHAIRPDAHVEPPCRAPA